MSRLIPLAALLALVACQKPEDKAAEAKNAEKAAAPTKVETAAVETRKMPRYLTLTGSVLADRQSEVAANVTGRITATYVERGQKVTDEDFKLLVVQLQDLLKGYPVRVV